MNHYLKSLYELLAVEYNCKPSDFEKTKNVVTISKLKEGRRRYGNEPYFFQMVTTGENAVITADTYLQEFLLDFSKDRLGRELFETQSLILLNKELEKYNKCLTSTWHMFLPRTKVELKNHYPTKWFYDKEIFCFYGQNQFPNAISKSFNKNRPDKIVVCAYDGEKIMGMAGCSEDAPKWYQIGVDVLPQYRNKGIATYLVTLLKDKIIKQGNIPFYGTTIANYSSWNVALKSGFTPAWLEIGYKKL